MQNDFIIVLAWPEGMVIAAGAWYDSVLATNRKYRVGHSALVLVNATTNQLHYFDFGRYHTPEGFGRVRDLETDPDVSLLTKIEIKDNRIVNINELLNEIKVKKSSHGEGTLYASVLQGISFEKAYLKAKKIQNKGAIPYGPLVIQGTNCSRFVACVMRAANPGLCTNLRLKYPFCLSPSPKRNISIANPNYYVVDNSACKAINKSFLKSYFTSIERL